MATHRPSLSGLLAPLIVVVTLLCSAPAFAHAVLMSSIPADGAVLSEAPGQVRLDFSEPVSLTSLNLLSPSGEKTALTGAADNAFVEAGLPDLVAKGSYALSYRIISADGHPIAGTLIFSIGEPSAGPVAADTDPAVDGAVWVLRVLFYVGLFVGAGSAASRGLLGPMPKWVAQVSSLLIVIGLLAAFGGIGVQGLDALGRPLSGVFSADTWSTGFGSGIGVQAILAGLALLVGAAILVVRSQKAARGLSVAVLVLAGLALSATGHAATADPQWLMRPAVFLHAAAILFWIGSVLPLIAHLASGKPGLGALARFSQLAPYAVLPLVVSGLALAIVQLGLPSPAWISPYALILATKLGLLAVLFAFALWNRVGLTKPALAGELTARLNLRRSVIAELLLALAIFGLVAGWRFTPPPRALAEIAAPQPMAMTHLYSNEAMVMVSFGNGRMDIQPMTAEDYELDPKEISVTLGLPELGVEPFSRKALRGPDGIWSINDLILPAQGAWTVAVDLLVSDFKQVKVTGVLETGDPAP